MKRTCFLLGVMVGGLLFSGCFDEDPIHAELEYGRVYDTTSSDPVLNYISRFYYNYDKEIIFDPDTVDYVFNFQSKNDLKLVRMNKERWEEGLEWIRTNFIKYYNSETMKKSFPKYLIIVDSIYSGDRLPLKTNELYTTRNMMAFAIDKFKKDLPEDAKRKLVMSYHTNFINFCIVYGRINIDQFYTIGESRYGKYEYGKQYTKEEAYAAGFLKVSVGVSFWDDEEYTYFPDRSDDFTGFLNLLITGSEEERIELMNTYAAIKTKFEILINAFESGGIDYKTLRNI